MTDLLHTAEAVVSSPWLYVVLIAVSLLDSFLPAVPSEPVVVVAGVAAANGDASLTLVIGATAVGAFAGDCVPYGLGRALAGPVLGRLPTGSRRRRVHDRLSAELDTHAAQVLIVSRFVPVGRYLVTVSAGIGRLPIRMFVTYTGISVIMWSAYVVLAGYVGGSALQDNPLLAVGAGLGLALVVSTAIHGVARRRVAVDD